MANELVETLKQSERNAAERHQEIVAFSMRQAELDRANKWEIARQQNAEAEARHVEAVEESRDQHNQLMAAQRDIERGIFQISGNISRMSNEICDRLDRQTDIQNNPRRTEALELFRRALTNFQKDYFKEALDDIQEAIEKDKTYYRAWFLEGEIYALGEGEFGSVKDLDKALEAYTNAAKYIKRDAETLADAKLIAAEIWYEMGKHVQYQKYQKLLAEGNKAEAEKLLADARASFERSWREYSNERKMDALYEAARCKIKLGEGVLGDVETLIKRDYGYFLKLGADADFAPVHTGLDPIVTGMKNAIYAKAAPLLQQTAGAYEQAKQGGVTQYFLNDSARLVEAFISSGIDQNLHYLEMRGKYHDIIEVSKALSAEISRARTAKNVTEAEHERKHQEIAARLSEIRAKPVNNKIPVSEYNDRIAELKKIAEELKALPAYIDVTPDIRDYEVRRKQCEEAIASIRKKYRLEDAAVRIISGVIGIAAFIGGIFLFLHFNEALEHYASSFLPSERPNSGILVLGFGLCALGLGALTGGIIGAVGNGIVGGIGGGIGGFVLISILTFFSSFGDRGGGRLYEIMRFWDPGLYIRFFVNTTFALIGGTVWSARKVDYNFIGKIICVILIVASGITGYITISGRITALSAQEAAAESPQITATVTSGVLNVRAGPSGSSDVIMQVYKDDILTVTGAPDNGWLPVEYYGKSGYVSTQFVRTE